MSLGFTEIILIVLFILIVFGAKRIPELARAMGRASYEFKKAKNALSTEGQELMNAAEKAAAKEEKQEKERAGSRSIFVAQDMAEGEVFTEQNIRCIRPGIGLHTMYYEEILGRKASCPIGKGTPLSWNLIR